MSNGDGWTTCAAGHRHWGLFGAAGLLLRGSTASDARVLLQLRVGWSHHGGTWGTLGGARHDDETAVVAALREAGEESSLDPAQVRVEGTYLDDHGGWSYTTVLASALDASMPAPEPRGGESDAVRWFAPDELDALDLHPGFARTWPTLRPLPPAPVLVVDAANVMGSRPDGWWRDRAGAARRLRDGLAAVPADGWPADVLRPPTGSGQRPSTGSGQRPSTGSGSDGGSATGNAVFPVVVLVVEGQARGVEAVPGVEVVAASGSGDDAIVAVVQRRAGGPRPVVVVTADRELRRRVTAAGAAEVVGPRTLLDLL